MNDPEEIIQNSQSDNSEQKGSSPFLLNIIRWMIILVLSLSLPATILLVLIVYENPLYNSWTWLCFLPGFFISLILVLVAYLLKRKNVQYNFAIHTWIFLIYNSLFLIPIFSEFAFPGFLVLYLLWGISPVIILLLILSIRRNNKLWFSALKQCFVFIIIVHFLMSFFVPQLLGARRGAWYTRCIETLETLAQHQHDYAQSHEGRFGTWQDLIDQNFIQQGYNQTNIIDNYSLAVFKFKNPDDETNKSITPSFVIVAIPRSPKNRLRTFGICEDQHPRIWIGDTSSFDLNLLDLKNDNKWKPIR